ncbi:nitroreductase/quinone reductase family protein [Mycobacterium sp. D16R24]|uniref:nitroreductase/quinone reductase family protein n=1 Tax=Mycobacterium sp. D16R24 TaxID=1855656 RepID=UPI00336AD501
MGVLTTIGRRSGSPRITYVKAVRDGDRAYLAAITGRHTLWVKNIQARRTALRGGSADRTWRPGVRRGSRAILWCRTSLRLRRKHVPPQGVAIATQGC